MRRPLSDSEAIGAALGTIVALAVAGLLGGMRGEVSQANAGLVLVLVIIGAAAVGGRWAGGATALASALSFDFFLTKPYNSLAIKSGEDILTTALLFVAGIAVGQIARSQWDAKVAGKEATEEVGGLHRITQLAAQSADLAPVIEAAEQEVAGVLMVPSCRFTLLPLDPPLPELEQNGRIKAPYVHEGRGFVLPADGIVIPVRAGGRILGWMATAPADRVVGVSLDRRRTALVLVGILGLAIDRSEHSADAA